MTDPIYEPLRYPSYYPALTLDHLWTIVSTNEAYTKLIHEIASTPSSVVKTHFIEHLFEPSIRQALGGQWHPTILRVMRAFQSVMDRYLSEAPEQRPEFDRLIARLSGEVAGFSLLWKAASTDFAPQLPEFSSVPIPACEVDMELTTPLLKHALLRFASMAQFQQQILPEYQITLVPQNHETAAATLLLHLAPLAKMQEYKKATSPEQILWGLAFVKTLEQGIARGAADWQWEPSAAFRTLFKELGEKAKGNIPAIALQLGEALGKASNQEALSREWLLDKLAYFSYDRPHLYQILPMERDIYRHAQSENSAEEGEISNHAGVDEPDEQLVSMMFDTEEEYDRFLAHIFDQYGGEGIEFTNVPIRTSLRVTRQMLEKTQTLFQMRQVTEKDIEQGLADFKLERPFDPEDFK